MNILIAIDSYKGSMTSLEAGNAAKKGILKQDPQANVTVKALADGGEGTYRTLTEALGGRICEAEVKDPLGRPVTAHYGLLADGTAVLEMAESSGIALLSPAERDPVTTNTFGFGELLTDAYKNGAKSFLIGIGGSATTEMGIGMLAALGFTFRDGEGNEVEPGLEQLGRITRIEDAKAMKDILKLPVELACDVTNPLCGDQGAVAVFGPQKGVRPEEITSFDGYLQNFSRVVNSYTGRNLSEMPGAGAAGGLGFTIASSFEKVTVRSGADLVMDRLGMESAMEEADLVITGEGRIDNQTASGKGPGRIAQLAKEHDCHVIGLSGCLDHPYDKCLGLFDEIIKITPDGMTIEEAMKQQTALKNMEEAACRLKL